jgi:hypothetical protein
MKRLERSRAREFRVAGESVNHIAEKLGVSKGSVSLWVRDIPQPAKFGPDARKKKRMDREQREQLCRKNRLLERLARPVYSGDVGRRLIRTPVGYKGTTLISGRYVYEHRYVAEQQMGRLLRKGEVVHHINGDIHDNRPDNLIVRSFSRHLRDHRPAALVVTLTCPTCGRVFERFDRYCRYSKQRGQRKFFCSHKCNTANQHSKGGKLSLLVREG